MRIQTLVTAAFLTLMANAQTWVAVTDAPASWLCHTLSEDKCQLARDGGMLFVTNDGGSSFDSSQTMFTSEWFMDMHFPTDQVGYACGGSHYGYYKDIIAKTVDGGTTWSPLTHDEYDWYSFNRIRFVTEDIGFVAGDVNVFLKTTDGGATFDQIDLQLPEFNNVRDIQFDGNTGYICTRSVSNLNNNDYLYRILKTTDLGTTWSVLYTDSVFDSVYTTDRGVNSIRFMGQLGMACGNNGLLLRTEDGGASWTETTVLNDTTFFTGLEMANEQTAFLTSQYAYAGMYRNTMQTNDGGLTWFAIPHKFHSISIRNGAAYAIDETGQLWKNAKVLLGVEEPQINGLELFPNPTSNNVTVILPSSVTNGRYTIIDPSGRVLTERDLAGQTRITIDLSGNATGAYMLQIRDAGSGAVYRERIVLE